MFVLKRIRSDRESNPDGEGVIDCEKKGSYVWSRHRIVTKLKQHGHITGFAKYECQMSGHTILIAQDGHTKGIVSVLNIQ